MRTHLAMARGVVVQYIIFGCKTDSDTGRLSNCSKKIDSRWIVSQKEGFIGQ